MARPIGQVAVDDVLRFQVHRIVTNLFKNQLVLLEDLAQDHDAAMAKLHASLPAEYQPYVKLADYLDEDRGARLRSKTLDAGNEAIRALEEQLAFYDIHLRKP